MGVKSPPICTHTSKSSKKVAQNYIPAPCSNRSWSNMFPKTAGFVFDEFSGQTISPINRRNLVLRQQRRNLKLG